MKNLNRQTVSRKQHPVRVLQFGDGNFLRGFADWIIDIMNERAGFESGVRVVAPLRRGRASINDKQDGLYHTLLRGIYGGQFVDELRLITCIDGSVNPYAEHEAFLKTGTHAELLFVISNTTEAGITFSPSDTSVSATPDSFPAKVTQVLYERFRAFAADPSKGLVFFPCELIENNGDELREIVLRYATYWRLPAEFSHWIERSCTFCNTLVDRIVTGLPGDELETLQQRCGYADSHIVAAEPYHLWVIENKAGISEMFPADKAGLNVKFVPDITPYRTRKVRILNGAHTAMTLVGYLRGFRTVRETIEDEAMHAYIEALVTNEVIPTIPLPADELIAYRDAVFERFRNPEIRHELKSIALNSVSKFRARLLPALLDYYRVKAELPSHIVQALAALIVFCRGTWRGEPLPVNDPDATIVQSVWKENELVNLNVLLRNVQLWGTDLSTLPGLEDTLKTRIGKLVVSH